MKVGIVSDIHGNVRALKSVLNFMKDKVDAYCFLGDYIGELPNVQECVNIMRRLSKEKQCFIIKGNKEEYLLNGLCEGHPEWDEFKSVVGMLRYSAASIDDKTKRFLCDLPISMVVSFEDLPDILICHGSLNSSKEPVLSHKYGINMDRLNEIKQTYIIQGHTHFQECLQVKGKHIWNPGTVGLPCNSRSETQFMIIEGKDGEWTPEYYNIEYDYMAVVDDMHRYNLYEIAPYWTKATETLITGKNKVNNGHMLRLAMEFCEAEEGSCTWPCVPEKYMKEAFERLYSEVANCG